MRVWCCWSCSDHPDISSSFSFSPSNTAFPSSPPSPNLCSLVNHIYWEEKRGGGGRRDSRWERESLMMSLMQFRHQKHPLVFLNKSAISLLPRSSRSGCCCILDPGASLYYLQRQDNCHIAAAISHKTPQLNPFLLLLFSSSSSSSCPTTNSSMLNGSWDGICTHCIHVFAHSGPTCMLGRCLFAKFLHRSSVGSFLRVRCWLGVPILKHQRHLLLDI